MPQFAALFPGQGSQSVGMLTELYNQYDIIHKTFEEASDALGFDLWQLVTDGPDSVLNQTINTQPAMLVADVAVYRAFNEQLPDIIPAFAAGHSLGEYAALVAANRIDFTSAVTLSRQRAEAMQTAVPEGVGAMAAIIGLDSDTIQTICAECSTPDNAVWAANDNAPGQIVIAGHKAAVQTACDQLKAAGAKRALILPVSVPSHTPLMQAAADAMQKAFANVTWQKGDVTILHNADIAHHDSDEALINVLTEQLIKPVRWVETIQTLREKDVDTFVEFGPGKVLAGLNKRIAKDATTLPIHDVTSMDNAIKHFSA